MIDDSGKPSGIFAPLYQCPKCGEIWHVQTVEEIDTENDEIYLHTICDICHSDVTPVLWDGHPVVHPLTDEELYWESSSDDDEEDYNRTCETCGGEFWDGGTSCTCDD